MQRHKFARAFKFTSFLALMLFTALLTGTLYAAPKVGPVTPENSIIGQYANDHIGSGGVYSLPSGNIVIVSPWWNNFRGAVTCLTPEEYKAGDIVISGANSLVGSNIEDKVGGGGIAILSNGNFVVASGSWNNLRGAATWINGASCFAYEESSRGAVVSLTNSLTGSKAGDQVSVGVSGSGITTLINGNYVVTSPYWDNDTLTNVGAATWVNGLTGASGVISVNNSLIGSHPGDRVGLSSIIGLNNGHYIVASPYWDDDTIINVGAVTWGNGATGLVGLVSPANSLIGTQENDRIGVGGVTALTNSNYVVSSPQWNYGAGAATWGDGTTGKVGIVSAANSMIGFNESADEHSLVSSGGITALSNGNYAVNSPEWNNAEILRVGAVTWGDGVIGTVGIVGSTNSLTGSIQGDYVGNGGITPLTNGNYVISSPYWNNPLVMSVGAATWVNGSTGATGVISAANSLIGSNHRDNVSLNDDDVSPNSGITALSNGNYVVSSPGWNFNLGAATWGDGFMGTVGIVSAANSLVGSHTFDTVSFGKIMPLTNGHYVVSSPYWDDLGAATWGNGEGGTIGVVSAANSLVGTQNDVISFDGIMPLTNGNYIVMSSLWDNGIVPDAGAITWGNGTVGTAGVVDTQNSIVGTMYGELLTSLGVVSLSDGNYVVRSPYWDKDSDMNVGMVFVGDGTQGTAGTISAVNSLVGSTIDDHVGEGGIYPLPDGSFIVSSPYWDNGAIQNVGAITWSDGALVAANNAPVLAEIGDKTVDVGATLTFDAEATDSDEPAQTLTYSIDGVPEDATFDTATGEFSWTPDVADSGQTFNLTVTVTDDGEPALSDSEDFTITVIPVVVEETNYLPNASFENAGTTNKTAAGWNGVGLTTNDKRVCDTETKTYALDGECAFRFQFNGATAPARTLQRNLNAKKFAKNDVVELRGMVKANGLTAGAKLVLKIVYNNGKTEAVNVKLTAGSHEYSLFTTPQITLKRPAKKITVQIRAGSAKGTFLVDDMAVVKVAAPLMIENIPTDSGLRGLD